MNKVVVTCIMGCSGVVQHPRCDLTGGGGGKTIKM